MKRKLPGAKKPGGRLVGVVPTLIYNWSLLSLYWILIVNRMDTQKFAKTKAKAKNQRLRVGTVQQPINECCVEKQFPSVHRIF